jgi:hypothetical protein
MFGAEILDFLDKPMLEVFDYIDVRLDFKFRENGRRDFRRSERLP